MSVSELECDFGGPYLPIIVDVPQDWKYPVDPADALTWEVE